MPGPAPDLLRLAKARSAERGESLKTLLSRAVAAALGPVGAASGSSASPEASRRCGSRCRSATPCRRYTPAVPPFDLSQLSEAELVDLNRRIVDRLRLIRAARHLVALADLAVGMAVEFTTGDGRTLSGTIVRLNRQTATVATPLGSWRVSPAMLRARPDSDADAAGRVADFPGPRRRS